MSTQLRRAFFRALAAAAFAAPALAALRHARRGWLTVEVAGDSMLPALEAGDWLLVRLTPPSPAPALLEPGAIALARDPSGRLLLKRVIGLPRESVELRDGHVHIDGRALTEPYARGETDPSSEFRTLTRLDRDAYYLLGDNRRASTDSRDHGPFRLGASEPPGVLGTAAIEGVAVLRYWPPPRLGRLRPTPRRFEG